MRWRYYLPLVVLASSLGLLTPLAAVAATQAPAQIAASNGISLTPAIQDQVLSPEQPSVSFPVQLFNHTDQSVTLSLSTVDFTSLNQTGGIAFEGGSVAGQPTPHGLSSFVKLSAQTITLAPNTAQTITASIKDVSKLAVGGHYGAVLAQTVSPPSYGGSNHVAINQVLSSLIFLQTAGQGTKVIKLLPPTVSGLSFSLPSSLNLVFDSSGNTQAVTRGTASISHGSTTDLQGIINDNSALILPDSTRLFQTQLHGNQHPWWPGRYQLEIQYRYEGSLGITTYQQSFLYINVTVLLLGILLLIIAIIVALKLLRAPRLRQRLRAFNSRTAAAMPLPVESPETPPQTVDEAVEEPDNEPAAEMPELSPEIPEELPPVLVPEETPEETLEVAEEPVADVDDEPTVQPEPAPALVPGPTKITVSEAVDPEPQPEPKPKPKPKAAKKPSTRKKTTKTVTKTKPKKPAVKKSAQPKSKAKPKST